ncbi:hypothetical protein CP556_11450 [Natrinema sp. CBA1119]|nr:hypothetical protein CP556_11450 [Natrinema sp. CBA1119]
MLETAKLVVRAGGSRDGVHCDDCSDELREDEPGGTAEQERRNRDGRVDGEAEDDDSDSQAEQAEVTSLGQRPTASERPDEVLILDRDERAPVAAADERHVRNTRPARV